MSGWTPVARRHHRKPEVPKHMNWALELGFRPITIKHMEAAGIVTRDLLCHATWRQLLKIRTMSEGQLNKVKPALGPAARPELDLPFWTPAEKD
jgi:hypothetical protein